MTKRKTGAVRGGARPGAGRKPYPSDVVAYLRTVDARRATIDAIRSSPGYRLWAIDTGRLVVLDDDAPAPACED
jgi:hypothetical protein